MATRMMTLLYGDKPGADVEPGNRVDTVDDLPAAAPPPLWLMEDEPSQPSVALERSSALGGLVRGLAVAAGVLAIVTFAIAVFVWLVR